MAMTRVLVFCVFVGTAASAVDVDLQSSIGGKDDDCDASLSQCHLGLIQSKVQKAEVLATATRSVTAEANSWEEGTCTVWGDGQVSVFDKAKVPWSTWFMSLFMKPALKTDFSTPDSVDFWLVKSDNITIQARYALGHKTKQLLLKGLAVSGDFIDGNIVTIGADDTKTLWNDQEILTEMESSFKIPGLFEAKYQNRTSLVENERQHSPGYKLKFDYGVSMLINRKPHALGAAITFEKPFGNQDGQCGNYNGDHEDDSAELISGRFGRLAVEDEDTLFRHAANRTLLKDSRALDILGKDVSAA